MITLSLHSHQFLHVSSSDSVCQFSWWLPKHNQLAPNITVYVFPDIFPSPKNFQGPGVLPKGYKGICNTRVCFLSPLGINKIGCIYFSFNWLYNINYFKCLSLKWHKYFGLQLLGSEIDYVGYHFSLWRRLPSFRSEIKLE